MRKTTCFILISVISFFMAISLLLSRSTGLQEYHSNLAYLNHLRIVDAAIDKEILLLYSGQVVNFDKLAHLTSSLTEHSIPNLSKPVQGDIRGLIANKVTGIDDFKSDLAIYRNSIKAARLIMGSQQNKPISGDEKRFIAQLTQPLLENIAFQDLKSLNLLDAEIRAISELAPPDYLVLQSLLTHARLILDFGAERLHRKSRASSNLIASQITRLHEHALVKHERNETIASRWEMFFTVMFLALICLVFRVLSYPSVNYSSTEKNYSGIS